MENAWPAPRPPARVIAAPLTEADRFKREVQRKLGQLDRGIVTPDEFQSAVTLLAIEFATR